MIRALWTAASGMMAQQLNIDTISNNLSNVNTTGFKKNRAEFEDLIYQTTAEAGTPVATGLTLPTGIQVGLGVRPSATQKLFMQGNIYQTENPLDIAIEGDGFFQVTLPDGTIAYTRDGSFKLDANGNVVTSDGYFIEPPITIPQNATSISISPEGVVSVKVPGQVAAQNVGQIQLARFVNPAGLKAVGDNLFKETDASGAPIVANPGTNGMGNLRQGFLEASNVQVVEEMVKLITAQRAYESNSKSIQTADDMLRIANGLKR
ncbi:MAG: flagellar basal-body rod protein FlgG [Synergistetes bacterium]|nr:flagellar basal-body rod protein FlgG [Synergistota bacterium]